MSRRRAADPDHHVSDTLHCQVAHRDDDEFEFFPSGLDAGGCGTFLATGGTVYGPAGGSPTLFPWTPVSQTLRRAATAVGDPLRMVTTVEIAAAAAQVEQTDSYVVGSQSYRTDVQVINTGNAIADRARSIGPATATCRVTTPASSRVDAARRRASSTRRLASASSSGRRSRRAATTTPASTATVWSLIGGGQHSPTCECACHLVRQRRRHLVGVEPRAGPDGHVLARDLLLAGRSLGAESYHGFSARPNPDLARPGRDRPDRDHRAGVILLVPFPSALFNSTLEENYDEVMAGIHAAAVAGRAIRGAPRAALIALAPRPDGASATAPVGRRIAAARRAARWPARQP